MGGIERHVLVLSKELRKYNHTVEVLVSNVSGKRKYEKIFGINVLRLPRFSNILNMPLTAPFFHIINKFKPSIIHLHIPNPWFELNVFIYSLFNKRAKIIATYHSDIVNYTPFHLIGNFFRKFYLLPLLKLFCNKIIATSPNYPESSYILEKVKDKIEVVPLSVDMKEFRPMKVKKMNKKVLLYVGRLATYKGLEYLLKAIEIVSHKRKDFILLIVGAGKLGEKLEALSKEFNISDFVKFTGRIDGKKLIYYYNLCDIFILPSVYKSEAFGEVQLEAMACGKPVISTNIKGSGVPFVNKSGETGLLVEPKNAQQLAVSILYLLEKENIRINMGKKARERVKKYFSQERMINNILKIYQGLGK